MVNQTQAVQNMNKVQLIGTLRKKPVLHNAKNQKRFLTFTVDVPRVGIHFTDHINCVLWDQTLVEQFSQTALEGDQVAVNGSIQTNSYSKNGETRFTSEISVTNCSVNLAARPQQVAQQQPAPMQQQAPTQTASTMPAQNNASAMPNNDAPLPDPTEAPEPLDNVVNGEIPF